jgi:hypothetical protein
VEHTKKDFGLGELERKAESLAPTPELGSGLAPILHQFINTITVKTPGYPQGAPLHKLTVGVSPIRFG